MLTEACQHIKITLLLIASIAGEVEFHEETSPRRICSIFDRINFNKYISLSICGRPGDVKGRVSDGEA